MRARFCLIVLAAAASLCTGASAQFKENAGEDKGPRLGEPAVQRWQAGMSVTGTNGPCTGLVGYTSVPIDWPEQQVTIVNEDVSQGASISYEMVERSVRLMYVSVPNLPAGQEAHAIVTYEVKRRPILPPKDPSIYTMINPKKVPNEVRLWLGPSPLIETKAPKVVATAKQISADKEKAWDKVKAIHDWVRENVKYVRGPVKGAMAALRDGSGGDEDLASVFIAICRAKNIPARTVWVPDTCYAEFYLLDDDGRGHWFPAKQAGDGSFGELSEQRPVLQKGDNFRPPRNRSREHQRYLAESLTGTGGSPSHRFIRGPGG